MTENSLSLYEINIAYTNLKALLLDDTEGDLDLETSLATIEDNQIQKVTNIGMIIVEMASHAAALKAHKAKINNRQKIFENGIERLKEYVKNSMIQFEQKTIEGDFVTVSRRKNPLKVEVVNADLIPERYIVTKEVKSIDKIKIREDFEATGFDVVGTQIVQNESILIKS